MKFAHISDTHLGYRQYGLQEREEDFYYTFDTIVDKIIEERVDFVIHSGDLFETNRPSPKALLTFQKGLLKLRKADIPVYGVTGNHDVIQKRGFVPPQALFRDLGLRLIDQQRQFYQEGDIYISGVPYMPKSMKTLLMHKIQESSKKAEEYNKSILILHQGIDKYLPFDYELETGELPKNFNYYAMGHVHNYINEPYGNGRLVYPGSTEIWKTNELQDYKKNGKGFVLVDMSGDTPETERIKVELPREFIKKTIPYNNLLTDLQILKNNIMGLKNKPIIDLTVEDGKFNTQEVYDLIHKTLDNFTINIRPHFEPDNVKQELDSIINEKTLEPRQLIIKKLEDLENDDVNNLALDLFDNLSKNKLQESEKIAANFFTEYFGEHGINISEDEIKEEMKKSGLFKEGDD
jgi:exonuclease SbcD